MNIIAFSVDPDAIQKQAVLFIVLSYNMFFILFLKIDHFTTWGFTDRYSWIPADTDYTKGVALPLNCQYQPKPAYCQLLKELFHVVAVDGIYRLSPQSQPDKCLGTYDNGITTSVQFFSGNCNNTNEKWNLTCFGDATYRFSSESANNRALHTYNATGAVGGVDTHRIGPHSAWWRVFAMVKTSNIVIFNSIMDGTQRWILTIV